MITLLNELWGKETVSRVAPLGLRFWDEVTASVIGDGLIVRSRCPNNPARYVQAVANRSGVYVLQDLPGLRDAEYGMGDPQYWKSLQPKGPFVIEVIDEWGRFLPFCLETRLPVRGFPRFDFLPSESPPAGPVSNVPLFSAPTRAAPAGMAAIRAELKELDTDRHAAWAVLEANYRGNVLTRGMADDQGRILLIFAYPEPEFPDLHTSPPGQGRSLRQQSWQIELRARYGRTASPPESQSVVDGKLTLADLSRVFQQETATLWAGISPSQPLKDVPLKFGEDLVLNTNPASEFNSKLLIS